MELFIYLRNLGTYDISYHRERNRTLIYETIKSKKVPDEMHIINECPDLNFKDELTFKGYQFLLSCPARFLLNDLICDNSSINRRFELANDDIDKKTDLFISLWECIMHKVMKKFAWSIEKTDIVKYIVYYGNPHIDKESVIFGECSNEPYFTVKLPIDIMTKYYTKPINYISELNDADYQQFFNFKLLSNEEAIQYLIPDYYIEISENESIRTNKTKMEYLTNQWMETLITDLG